MNAQMMKKTVKATVSTTYFTYDHINKKIDGTMENFELSGIPGSAQDLALMACQKAHPDYDFRIVKLKKEKNSYKGLKRELMYDYIDCFGSEEMMEKFQQHTVMNDRLTLYIDDICVLEECRGRHIGSAIYQHVLEYAKYRGCYNVTLNVWCCNESAMKFYESLGMKSQKIGMEAIL